MTYRVGRRYLCRPLAVEVAWPARVVGWYGNEWRHTPIRPAGQG